MEPNAPQTTQKPYNLQPNVEAALSYLLTFITGAIVYYFEKENKFVRFHAMQSIVFGIALIVVNVVIAFFGFVALILGPIVALGGVVLWLFLMLKAYNNVEYELPVLGKIARDLMAKS